MPRRFSLLFAVALPLAAGAAGAQTPPHPTIRGTIDAVHGDTLAVTARDGSHVEVRLAGNAVVTAIVRASLGDIKPNTYVGVANRLQGDGSRVAIEVHIFPDAARGTGDGDREWDLGADSRMTNGAIEMQVAGVKGHDMMVKYAGGESKILVTPETPVVAYERGDRAELTPGSKVIIRQVTAGPDGVLEAKAVGVGLNGITPPM